MLPLVILALVALEYMLSITEIQKVYEIYSDLSLGITLIVSTPPEHMMQQS